MHFGYVLTNVDPAAAARPISPVRWGHQACLKKYSVRYVRLSRLILALTQAKAKVDGSYSKLLKNLANFDLLIIDDWGLEPLKAATRNDLMEIMDDRHGQSATASSVNYLLTNGISRSAITPCRRHFRPLDAQLAPDQSERRIDA